MPSHSDTVHINHRFTLQTALQNDLQLMLADVLYSRWIKIYSVHVCRTASFINVSRFLVQTVLEISRKINSHKQTNAIKYAK